MIPSVRDLVTPFLTKEELARVEHLIEGTPKVTEVFEKPTDAYPSKTKSASTCSDISEEIKGDSIVCDNCGWTWKIEDGGDDLFMCHKCGHDNTPKEETNDFFKPLQNKQSDLDISPKFVRVDYYKDYYKSNF
jgi:DNA-directed RNA polymerase subunit RPC12/RpoP